MLYGLRAFRRPVRPLVLAVLAALVGGCVQTSPDTPPAPEAPEIRVDGALLRNGGVRDALSWVELAEGEQASVAFPEGVLVVDGRGMLVPASAPVRLAAGERATFLPPQGAPSIELGVESGGARQDVTLALREGRPLVSGDLVVELLKVQRDTFPHRTPGHENYDKAVDYFAQYFEALGYEVETFRAPLPPAKAPVGLEPSTQSVTSVVAYKRGVEQPDRHIVFGGHFDVVEQTTHGAFDNTGGTMAVLALAEAFSHVETSRTMVFAAWGGEEDGILGSQAWLAAHPELVPTIDLYLNYDVSGLAWPAPLVDPAPVVVATGPDGPAQETLARQHAQVASTYSRLDAQYVYEGVAHGQAAGAGVNAQSDHTPFMARGVPVVFQFTQRIDDVFALIHSERDTVENMTRYALGGREGLEVELAPAQVPEAEDALARSFETQMAGGFYLAVLTDGGAFAPARPASLPLLENDRS